MKDHKFLSEHLSMIFHKIIEQPININKSTNDILLKNIPFDYSTAHKQTIIKMRVGKLWEETFKLYGFIKIVFRN